MSSMICPNPAYLSGIDMISPTTGTAILTVYDSSDTDPTGKVVLAEMEVDAGMPSCNHEYANFVIANKGLYVGLYDPSGTATFIIRFSGR